MSVDRNGWRKFTCEDCKKEFMTLNRLCPLVKDDAGVVQGETCIGCAQARRSDAIVE